MLIIGAKGFAKQLFEEIPPEDHPRLTFYDEIHTDSHRLWNEFPILHTPAEAETYFEKVDDRFALGVGDPLLRQQLAERFRTLKGRLVNIVSPKASVSRYATLGDAGICILKGVIIEGDVSIGDGCLINLQATITHDCSIGRFTEISPGVRLSGGCTVGEFCRIGTGAVVLPKIKIGNSVVIGAGAVVTRDVPDNTRVVGVPARTKE